MKKWLKTLFTGVMWIAILTMILSFGIAVWHSAELRIDLKKPLNEAAMSTATDNMGHHLEETLTRMEMWELEGHPTYSETQEILGFVENGGDMVIAKSAIRGIQIPRYVETSSGKLNGWFFFISALVFVIITVILVLDYKKTNR